MKMNWTRRPALPAALVAAALTARAGGAVMTEYNFEAATIATGTSPANAFGPLAANIGTGSFTASHANSSAYSYVAGNGTPQSFSSNNWSSGDYYQFTSQGVAGLQLEFDQTSSATGPLSFNLLYSTNGTAFTNGGTYSINSGTSFSTLAAKTGTPPRYFFDFTGNSAVETAPTVTFRLSAATAGSGSGGTDRVDTIDVGTNLTPPSVPEPATASLAGAFAVGLLGRRRR